jgi:hypothetical protein
MSTKDTTDILMCELIALDSTFVEKEADMRVLVTLLAEKKPDTNINETFVRDLRAKLLVPHTFPLRSPYHKMNWWAIHLAPIGVVAILLLILMPNGLHYFEEPTTLREETPSIESSAMNVSDDASFSSDAPSAKRAPQSNDTGESTLNSYSVMEMNMDAEILAPDRFELGVQQPGISISIMSVTLTRPGYVVIHSFGPQGIGPVVGVSPIQNSGTTVGVPVYLRTVTHRGESYYAALYHDNGNGVFSISDDIPVSDPNLGIPTGVEFTIGIPEAW